MSATATSACRTCGASSELERDVVEHDARACLVCGNVRVVTSEVVYSDNPHVDPEVVEREASIDPVALVWVSAFPRRTRAGDAFLPARARATTTEDLAMLETKATHDALSSLRERILSAGAPAAPPVGHLSAPVAPFVRLHEALALSATTPIMAVASLVSYSGAKRVALDVAREHLASRAHAFREVLGAIDAFRPDMLKAILPARAAATPEEIAALAAAITAKIERTDPHSSDVTELRRTLDTLRL